MDSSKVVAATFSQLSKLYGSLSAAETEAIAAGTAKIIVLRPDQRVVEASPMIELALKAARAVKPEDIQRASAGGSSFKLAHKGGKIAYPVNVAEVAEQASRQGSEAAIAKFLGNDERLKVADLRKVADNLGIQLPSSAKKAEQVIAHIARSLAAFGS